MLSNMFVAASCVGYVVKSFSSCRHMFVKAIVEVDRGICFRKLRQAESVTSCLVLPRGSSVV